MNDIQIDIKELLHVERVEVWNSRGVGWIMIVGAMQPLSKIFEKLKKKT